MYLFRAMSLLTILILWCLTTVYAAVPSGFKETTIVSGLSSATAMAVAPDGRVFISTQGGSLRVVKNGSLLSTPFVTVQTTASGERGLLGVAFHPQFPTQPYVYVYYTATSPSVHNRVSRFTANGDVAVAGSETIILELDNLSSATNHNGGAIHFGPDGKLYIAVGENAKGSNSQTLSNLLGKVLRINVDGTIPTDNPFYTQATGKNRAIWAIGLRNPFTMAFDRVNGRLFINDVGQSTWEEINEGQAGANYGWPGSEGPTSNSNYKTPFYSYDHSGGACSIAGGVFLNSGSFGSSYQGDYFFGEFCAQWIRVIDPVTKNVRSFATGMGNLIDLRMDINGDLLFLSRNRLGRISSLSISTATSKTTSTVSTVSSTTSKTTSTMTTVSSTTSKTTSTMSTVSSTTSKTTSTMSTVSSKTTSTVSSTTSKSVSATATATATATLNLPFTLSAAAMPTIVGQLTLDGVEFNTCDDHVAADIQLQTGGIVNVRVKVINSNTSLTSCLQVEQDFALVREIEVVDDVTLEFALSMTAGVHNVAFFGEDLIVSEVALSAVVVGRDCLVDIGINFASDQAPDHPRYFKDVGETFKSHGQLSYGWTVDMTSRSRYRQSELSADLRYDTLVHMFDAGGSPQTFELEVDNGVYEVYFALGDPDYFGALQELYVEDVRALSARTTSTRRWYTQKIRVTVNDKRLTLRPGNGAPHTKLNMIYVRQLE